MKSYLAQIVWIACLLVTVELTMATVKITSKQAPGLNPTQLAQSQDILFLPDGVLDETGCSSAITSQTTLLFHHPILLNRVGAVLRNPCPGTTVTLSFDIDVETYRRDTEDPLTNLPPIVRNRLGLPSLSESQQLSPIVVFAASVTLSGLDFASPTGPAIVAYFPYAQGLQVTDCSDTGSAPGIVLGPLVETGSTDAFVSAQSASSSSGASATITGFDFTLSTASIPAPPPPPVWLPGYPSDPFEITLVGLLSGQLQTDNTNVISSYYGSPGIAQTQDGTAVYDMTGTAANLTLLTSTVSTLDGASYTTWTVCLSRLTGTNALWPMIFVFLFVFGVNAASMCICSSYSDKLLHRRWEEME